MEVENPASMFSPLQAGAKGPHEVLFTHFCSQKQIGLELLLDHSHRGGCPVLSGFCLCMSGRQILHPRASMFNGVCISSFVKYLPNLFVSL